ncbi:putative reverse transcriptase domain-containing protein [Tanacetum coccineum]|uniref:Reverse transcriptase domain-containing protein n=1 Tax=Tanacetum coccineum TaxID=301880 RepID=A0ABQ5G004_9ASTR
MRHRRWIELFSDHDCEICYHPGKANIVADALSRKEQMKPRQDRAMSMKIHSSIKARILEAQSEASNGANTLVEMLKGLDKQFERKEDGGLYLAERIWVPVYEIPEWKRENITMYFINKLPRTSSEHDAIWVIVDRLTKSAYSLANREDYKMKIFTRLYINEIMARHGVPVTTISDRDTWAEVGESKLFGPEIVQETTDKIVQIKERLKTVRDRRKSYAENRRKPLEFSVGDKVLLKVSPWKGVVRFGKRSKLSPRYVGPFEIVERVSPVAYRLRLP